jgi:hypothetical protein
MYERGLGLSVLAEFTDHDGFDGVVLGYPDSAVHLEFTTRRGHPVASAPTDEHLLVFYIPDRDEWASGCARLIAAGFRRVASGNPYWDREGSTFKDVDGYRVVLQNAAWSASDARAHPDLEGNL